MSCCVCCEEESDGRNDVRNRTSEGQQSTVAAPAVAQSIEREPLKEGTDAVVILSRNRSADSQPNKGSVSTNTTSSQERSSSSQRFQISDEESHSSELERVQRALQRPVKEQAAIASIEVHESLLRQSSKKYLEPTESIEMQHHSLPKQFSKRSVISAEGTEIYRYSKPSSRRNMDSIEEVDVHRPPPRPSPRNRNDSNEATEIHGPLARQSSRKTASIRRYSGDFLSDGDGQGNKFNASPRSRNSRAATIDSVEVDELSEVRSLSPIPRQESEINLQSPETQLENNLSDPLAGDANIDPHLSESIEVEIDELDAIVKALDEKERDRVNESGETEHSSKSATSGRSRHKSPPKLSPSSRDSLPIKINNTASSSCSSSRARAAKTSPDSEKSVAKPRRKSVSTPRSQGQDSLSPRKSSESYYSLLDQSESMLDRTKSKDSFPSHIRYEEATQPFDVALSDIPSDVDEDARERYLMACRILKATLIEKEQSLLPAEKSFLNDLLRGDEVEPSEAHLAALETASQTLLSDPLFRIESLSSAQFEVNDEESAIDQNDKVEWRNAIKSTICRAFSPTQTSVSEKTAVIQNRVPKPATEDNDEVNSKACSVATFSEYDDRDSPFKILGADQVSCVVLNPSLMEALRGFLPYSIAEENFWLKFSLERDGASLITLLSQIRASKHTIICIETKDGHVFGAFCSSHWRKQPNWYGSGESFLWRLKRSRRVQSHNDDNMNEMEIYPFTGHDELVQFCTDTTIAVGGGDWTRFGGVSPYGNEPTGIGLMIDSDLMGGETNTCATFENPRLCGRASKSNEFDVFGLEVWTVTPCITVAEAERLEMHRLFVEEHTAKI